MKHRKNEPESMKVGYIKKKTEISEKKPERLGQIKGENEKSSEVTNSGAFPRKYSS